MWLHNGISNAYFSNGLDGDQDEAKAHQYECQFRGTNDSLVQCAYG